MTTLIVVYNSDGIVGRCDAACYGAKAGTVCRCCCGGINHAVGLGAAIANCAKAFDNAAEYAKSKASAGSGIYSIAAQLGLEAGGLPL